MRPPAGVVNRHSGSQKGRWRRTPAAPRTRRRLLKGCEQPFHPRQANQRYCSAACRKAARRWSRWKAQQRYRATPSGKTKRTDQSRRYRERVKTRKPPEPEADNEAARVITPEGFFRRILRSARLLRAIHAAAAKSFAALLFPGVSASTGARQRTGTPLETGADLKLEVLLRRCGQPYIQPV